jgi:hypothetical protein
MAATRTLAHNPNATSDVCCWSSMGENVGVGSSVSQVQSAFMNSSPHRANILSSTYTQVGIGTARGSDGRLYVDEVFRRPTSAGASAPSVTTTVHRAPRSAPARASRSAARLPHPAVHRSVRRVAPAALTHRLTLAMLREAGRNVRAAARHDSVAGAFGYLRLMVTLTR